MGNMRLEFDWLIDSNLWNDENLKRLIYNLSKEFNLEINEKNFTPKKIFDYYDSLGKSNQKYNCNKEKVVEKKISTKNYFESLLNLLIIWKRIELNFMGYFGFGVSNVNEDFYIVGGSEENRDIYNSELFLSQLYSIYKVFCNIFNPRLNLLNLMHDNVDISKYENLKTENNYYENSIPAIKFIPKDDLEKIEVDKLLKEIKPFKHEFSENGGLLIQLVKKYPEDDDLPKDYFISDFLKPGEKLTTVNDITKK
jgi:hypothetical protein